MTLQEVAQVAQIISTVAITASAITAVGVLIYTKRTNRRRATLDMVMRTFVDDSGRKLYDSFITLTRRNEDEEDAFTFADLNKFRPEIENDRNTVIDQMNTYELVALGVRKGVFDENFYKRWYHGQFVRDYKALEPLIVKIQQDRPSTFCEFKSLYEKWEKNRHPVNHPGKITKAFWALTGKDDKLKAVVNSRP